MSERVTIRLLTAALVAAVVAPWLVSAPRPAFATPAAAEANGVLAITAPGNGTGQNVLFLIDTSMTRLMVFEHKAGGQLQLTAVRTYEFEREFEQWPGRGSRAPIPSVGDVKKEVRKLEAERQQQQNNAGS